MLEIQLDPTPLKETIQDTGKWNIFPYETVTSSETDFFCASHKQSKDLYYSHYPMPQFNRDYKEMISLTPINRSFISW